MEAVTDGARVRRVLVLNSGSSTFKWTLFDASDETAVDEGSEEWAAAEQSARAEQIRGVVRRLPGFDAVGHRVVHGGERFRDTALVDQDVRAALTSLVDLDPLHMLPALAGIDAIGEGFAGTPQFAAFDSGFHATMSEAASGYAVPFEWTERFGVRRFGFHGLSVRHAVDRARTLLLGLPARMVVCHLGSGCSMTAVRDGKSIDTTMGLTPLDGLVMSTRSGSVDPGLWRHLARQGMTPEALTEALTERSGLLGVSGISGDLRQVLAAADAGNPRATLAYDRFILSARRHVGAMMAILGGLDALIFTGGIGENSLRVRRDVCSALGFAGVHLDDANTRSPDVDVSVGASAVRVLVIRAREDLVILRDVLRLSSVTTPADRTP